jgi:hypothetical protein
MQNLAAALVVAQANARIVAKDKTNDYHRYPYASAEAMIDEGRQSLSNAGLALMSAGRAFVSADAPPGDKGPIGRVHIKYKLVHTSGEALDFESSTAVIPEKGRPADKAEAAAVTSDLAYTLRGLLLLSRGLEDGGSIDGRDDREYDRRPESRQDDRGYDRPQSDPAPRSAERPAPRASVGDNAAAAQTGVEQRGGQPVRSAPTVAANETRPAVESPWEPLCVDFERRAATEPLATLYDEVKRSPLPKEAKCRAILAIVLRAFEVADNTKDLDGWSEVAAAAELHRVYEARLQAGWDAAETRLAKAS